MFSGKSTELLRRLRCSEIAGQPVYLLKPSVDDRAGTSMVATHAGDKMECAVCDVSGPTEELDHHISLYSPQVVGIDEAQFLDPDGGWIDWIRKLSYRGVEVVCALLNQDYLGRPFGLAPYLLASADDILHLKAVCGSCGQVDAASRSHRRVPSQELVLIGGGDTYSALCWSCWDDERSLCTSREE
jgi:thymidine kinase